MREHRKFTRYLPRVAVGTLLVAAAVATGVPASAAPPGGRDGAATESGRPLPDVGLKDRIPSVTGAAAPIASAVDGPVSDLAALRPVTATVQALRDQLDQPGERVRVMVQVRMRWVPDPALGAVALAAQTAQMNTLQDALLRRIPGAVVVHRYDTPALSLEVTRAELDALAAAPEVATVEPVRTGNVEDNSSAVPTRYLDAQAVTADGAGQTVAVIDSGLRRDHEYLSGRVVAEACFAYETTIPFLGALGDCPGGRASATGTGASAPCAASNCFHGTWVAGIAAGDGSAAQATADGLASGVAPRSNVIGVRVFSESTGDCDDDGVAGVNECNGYSADDLKKALDWLYDQRLNHRIAAVNISLGGSLFSTACDTDPVKTSVDRLVAAGIAVVKSTGNTGMRDQVTWPGCISSMVVVGGTDDSDGMYIDTNAHSTLQDLWAPAVAITSSDFASPTSYESYSGTSAAAPHVAGLFALMQQRAKCDPFGSTGYATVSSLLAAMQQTGTSVKHNRPAVPAVGTTPALPAGSVTKMRINAYRAVRHFDVLVPHSNVLAAQTITGASGKVTGTNACAGKEILGTSVEPSHGTVRNQGGGSVWFRWTAPSTGTVRFTTMGSNFDTLLGAYQPVFIIPWGKSLAQNDDALVGVRESQVSFAVTGGTEYFIAIDGYRNGPLNAQGTYVLEWSLGRPTNDDLAQAQPLLTAATPAGTIAGSTARATTEFGEPAPLSPSVWFRWTAPATGKWTFATTNSTFDTVLDAYSSSNQSTPAFANLALLTSDDDSGPLTSSLVTVNATIDTTYWFRLRGWNGATGSYALHWRHGTAMLRIADASAAENAGSATVTVTLDGPSASAVTLGYATANGTATSPLDYVARAGTVSFEPGQLSATIPVTLVDDVLAEGSETFALNGTSLSGALVADVWSAVIITDNDAARGI